MGTVEVQDDGTLVLTEPGSGALEVLDAIAGACREIVHAIDGWLARRLAPSVEISTRTVPRPRVSERVTSAPTRGPPEFVENAEDCCMSLHDHLVAQRIASEVFGI
jgi:hypothetical protein